MLVSGEAKGVHREKFTWVMSRHRPSHLASCVLVCLWSALAFVPSAFSVEPNTQEIIKHSIAATETDWKAIPDFSDIERDAETKGGSTTSKTYKVLMIDGSPYYHLIAVDDEPLSSAEQARESGKLERVITRRSTESEEQRAKRLAHYQEDRNRMFALMRAMGEAFDFKLAGEERLEDHDVYVFEATPRPEYQPNNRDRLWWLQHPTWFMKARSLQPLPGAAPSRPFS